MTKRRSTLWAVLMLFAAEAVITGLIYARIPDIKAGNGLSDAALGLVLIGMPIGNIFGFMLAPYMVGRVGLTKASWLSVAVLGALSLGVGFAETRFTLIVVFALLGLCLSHTEVTQNAMAGHIERTTGRRVMSRCHGGWSIGSIAGLLAGGAFSQMSIPVSVQGGVAAVAGVAAAAVLARSLPHVPRRAAVAGNARIPIKERIPKPALLLLCILPLGTLALEGIVRDWGAIFMRSDLGAAPFSSTLLLVVLSTSMAVVRLSGDSLLERLGERLVVAGSILCASAGLLAIAVAPSMIAALAGAAVTGVGVAVVYPVALSIAARRFDAPERDVATMSFICFVTLMASPAAVGFLSEAVGLRITFAAFALLSLLALLLLPVTGKRQ
ncbi:MFS transporter [uncultured Martelella sp.]|uniref:MFS transporter n=1 Tax=uncultured Martelella sp. TaxID=392331 RepID=UPI0029C7B314|nr:MFS transporter [uncultured Martelella sp.]